MYQATRICQPPTCTVIGMKRQNMENNSSSEMWNTTFLERECGRCHKMVMPIIRNVPPHEIHGYATECPHCRKFLAWGGKKKPIKDESGKRLRATQWTAKRLGISSCQLCRQPEEMIKARGEQLEVHHLVPIKEGGEDEPVNLLVLCTDCHRSVHYRQTYLHDHTKHLFAAWKHCREMRLNVPGM